MQPVRESNSTALRSRVSNQPSGLFFSAPGCGSQHPRVPWAARASCWPLPQQLLPASATGRGRRCCRSHPVGMSNVVAAAAFARGIFNLTRTGIAAELTAASEQRLPPVGGRCRIATKRGVQGSEAGAVVSGMRTPLQGVKHTLGTTTRDRAAVRLHLEYHMPFMDKKPGRGTRSGALLPGFSAFSVNFRPEIVTKLCQCDINPPFLTAKIDLHTKNSGIS